MNAATAGKHQARFGPFLIMRKIGEGAMAKVYLARRIQPSRGPAEVALKVLRREYSQQDEVLQLIKREAVIGEKMRHPNVVATLEGGEIDGLPYLAMEYVQGVTAQALLELSQVAGSGHGGAHRPRGQRVAGGLPPQLVACLMVQVCDGLSYAHNLQDDDGRRLDVVHRDLKPGNVMVSLSGVAKVMDFGVAKIKVYGGETTLARTTRGTPAYMSPEQARGLELTHRSDIFATGLLLYELVTGAKPFVADSLNDLLRKVRDADVTGLAERLDRIHPGLGRVFARTVAFEPDHRYPDASWMKEDLEQLFPPQAAIPAAVAEEDAPTRYHAIGTGDDADDRTQYHTIEGADTASSLGPAPSPVVRAGAGARDDDTTRYYRVPGAEGDDGRGGLPPLHPPPRLLDPDQEAADEVPSMDDDALESADDDLGMEMESIPELDLEDDTIPEVDLGAPVFLELNTRPDPAVPVAENTLSHLTNFLVETEG